MQLHMVNNTLPTEILSMIFVLLSPKDRCQAELVCHTWHRLSRSSHHIWKFATNISGDDIPDPILLKNKLDNILLRSGGKLHTLAIRISSSTKCEANSSRHMLNCLPATEVKHLWIDCGTRWTCQVPNDKVRLLKNSFNSNLRKCTSRIILNCGDLQSLHLATPQGTECIKLAGGEPLLSQCEVNSLSLLSDSFESLFADPSTVKVARQLKNLQIRSIAPGWDTSRMSFQRLLRLLQQCSQTLEWAEVEAGKTPVLERDEHSCWTDAQCQQLPLLRYLRLICCKDKSDAQAQIENFLFPQCPALSELHIVGKVPEGCISDLIAGSFSSLKIFSLFSSSTKLLNDPFYIKQLCKHLQSCHKLKKISVEGPTNLILDHLSKTGLSRLVQDQNTLWASTQGHLSCKTRVSDVFQ